MGAVTDISKEVQDYADWMKAGKPNPLDSELAWKLLNAEGTPEAVSSGLSPQTSPETIADSNLQLPNIAKEFWKTWQESRGPLGLVASATSEPILPAPTLTPATRESAMPSLEEAIAKVSGPTAEVPAPTTKSVTPAVPPFVPPAPSETYKASEKGLTEGTTKATAPSAPTYPSEPSFELPNVAPAPMDYEKEGEFKNEEYFAKLLQDRSAAFPQTKEAALQSVGRTPEEFQLQPKSVGRKALEAFFAGLNKVDYVGTRDKEQMRLRELELKELDFAMKKFSHEDQVRVAQFQMERENDRVKRDAAGQAATFALQNLPPNFGSNPGDAERMQQIMGQLGASWRLPPKYVQSTLDKAWDPATGKYTNLYLSPIEKWKLENMAKADMMEQMFPGYSKDVYYSAQIFGKWPEWADDTAKSLDREIAKAVRVGDNSRAQTLTNQKNSLVRYQQLVSVNNFSEMVNKLVKTMDLDAGVAESLMVDYVAKISGGETGLAKEVVKGKYGVLKEQAKGAAKAAGTTNAADQVKKAMDTQSQLRMYAISKMNPAAFQAAKQGKDTFTYDDQVAAVNAAYARMEAGKGTPQDQKLVQDYTTGQLLVITQFLPKEMQARKMGGQLPQTREELDALYEKAVQVAAPMGTGVQDRPITFQKPQEPVIKSH